MIKIKLKAGQHEPISRRHCVTVSVNAHMYIKFPFKPTKNIFLGAWTVTFTHKNTGLLPGETKAGYLSVLPRGGSQWGAAFSSCLCECCAVPKLHLGKSTKEKLRAQALWLLWRRQDTGDHYEVNEQHILNAQKYTTNCVKCKIII